jgi:MATE family multidrug resistance protein
VLSGRFGPDILGGHHLAIMIASFTFSVCLGVSSATSVRVGHAIGRSDTPAARCAGFVGIATGLGFMSISALCLWLGAWPIAKLFAKPTEVVAAAVPLLYIAAIFQLFDGTQIIASGALRGIGETKMPMRINIVGYWLLALPTALVLAFYCKLEAVGLWWGLTMGLMITSIFLTTGFHRITKNKIQPIAAL